MIRLCAFVVSLPFVALGLVARGKYRVLVVRLAGWSGDEAARRALAARVPRRYQPRADEAGRVTYPGDVSFWAPPPLAGLVAVFVYAAAAGPARWYAPWTWLGFRGCADDSVVEAGLDRLPANGLHVPWRLT